MKTFTYSQAVEFTYVTADNPYRHRVYGRCECKCPERTRMWRELEEFSLRRDALSWGWRIIDEREGSQFFGKLCLKSTT